MQRKLNWRKFERDRIVPQVVVGVIVAVIAGLLCFVFFPTSGGKESSGIVLATSPLFQEGPNLTMATVELDDGTRVVAQASPNVAAIFAGDRVLVERHEGLLGKPVIIVTQKVE